VVALATPLQWLKKCRIFVVGGVTIAYVALLPNVAFSNPFSHRITGRSAAARELLRAFRAHPRNTGGWKL
jgi:hypothetical protein